MNANIIKKIYSIKSEIIEVHIKSHLHIKLLVFIKYNFCLNITRTLYE